MFDAGATLISPLLHDEKNASSGFSSRGCSPSPCQSLSSDTELSADAQDATSDTTCIKADITNDVEIDKLKLPLFKNFKSSPGLFERSSTSTPILKQNKEYLQSFDRRHSDSKYVSNRTYSLEKVNLAEEIRKLSNRLLMLSSINTELQDINQHTANNCIRKCDSPAASDNYSLSDTHTTTVPTIAPVDVNETTKNWKNSKLNSEFSQSTISCSGTTLTNTGDITTVDGYSTHETSKQSNVKGLTERLNMLDETPSSNEEILNRRNVSRKSLISGFDSVLSVSINSSDTSTTSPTHNNNVPWPVTNRRTKFRITQLSRDISHDTIFLEETAVNTTKCLLHLLDKYNGSEKLRSSNGFRRHQSITVGGGIANNLEYQSMNSINAFFKRNVFQKNGTTVKQIQTRFEAKSN